MRPDVAVTEFLYAHDYAAKSWNWYDGMLTAFTAFTAYSATQGVSAIEHVTASNVHR